jgi:hypothetical protein
MRRRHVDVADSGGAFAAPVRLRRAIILSFLVAAGLFLVPLATADAYVPRAANDFFGVNAQGLNQDGFATAEPGLLDRQAQAIGHDLGAGWARVNVDWGGAESLPPVNGQHSYNLALTDSVVAALARAGVPASLQLSGTPAWATSPANVAACALHRAAPTDLDSFAAFAGAVTRRYGPGGQFWAEHPDLPYQPVKSIELWNEPNWPAFWCPSPDPEAFAQLLDKGADAVHNAAPGEQVILGGLVAIQDGDTAHGMPTADFLRRVYAAQPGLRQKVDAVGFHAYGASAEDDLRLVSWFRSVVDDQVSAQTPIYLNEFGWPTQGGGYPTLSEADRAAQVRSLAHVLWRTDCGIGGIALHTWHTPELNPTDGEDWFGIADPETAALYPTGQEYRDQIALAEGKGSQPAPRQTVHVCGRADPDSDGDGVSNSQDDYPLDPTRSSGSGEVNPEDNASPPQRVHAPSVPDPFFGVDRGTLWSSNGILRERQLDAVSAAHLGRLRMPVSWRSIQPAAPGTSGYTLNWNDLDAQVYSAAKRGLKPQLYVIDRPGWAGSTPSDIATNYAAFMRLVAQRYGRGGSFWHSYPALPNLPLTDYEVWYDANWSSSWWDGSASPQEYADAYTKVRSAVRAVDPQARTFVALTGYGSTLDASQFIRQLGVAVDGAEVAMYGLQQSQVESLVVQVRRALRDTGSAQAPITVQVGYTTSSVTDDQRATLYRSMLDRFARSDCGLDAVTVNNWVGGGYGIADPQTGALNASGQAVSDEASLYGGWSQAQAPTAPVALCAPAAPSVTGSSPASPANNNSPKVVGSADSGSTVKLYTTSDCSGSPAATGTASDFASPGIAVSVPDDSSTTFHATASDQFGGVSPCSSSSVTYREDSTPPDTQISSGPSGPTNSTNASFSFTSEAGASFQCRLDSTQAADWQPCSSPKSYSSLPNGTHTFEVRAVDPAGNADPTPATRTFRVDTSAPQTTIDSGPSGNTRDRTPTFSFHSSEAGSSFTCKLDTQAWGACSSPKTYSTLALGSHTFRVRAQDQAGNVDSTPASRTFKILK